MLNCPLWVISRFGTPTSDVRATPQQRTCSAPVPMSALCQKRKSAAVAKVPRTNIDCDERECALGATFGQRLSLNRAFFHDRVIRVAESGTLLNGNDGKFLRHAARNELFRIIFLETLTVVAL